MSYPLFDSGYTLWAADIESRLKEQLGESARSLGIDHRLLLHSYYTGYSVTAALALISSRHGLDAFA
ncbi:hypothetical protein [Paramagnetospirillum kuznetsovii]|nr:hypothetical protein [Paramagnetospirillum kuznetsovii]